MLRDIEIREQLANFLSGSLSLEQFEDWLVQNSWNMHKDADDVAQHLASEIELRLSEHSSGHLSDSALRNELLPFVTKYETRWLFVPDSPLIISGATNSRVGAAFPIPMPQSQSEPYGTLSVAVYG